MGEYYLGAIMLEMKFDEDYLNETFMLEMIYDEDYLDETFMPGDTWPGDTWPCGPVTRCYITDYVVQ